MNSNDVMFVFAESMFRIKNYSEFDWKDYPKEWEEMSDAIEGEFIEFCNKVEGNNEIQIIA